MSPSIHHDSAQRGGGASGASLVDVSAFMTEQLKEQLREQRGHDEKKASEQRAREDAMRQEIDTLREAALESRLREKVVEMRAGAAAGMLRGQQLAALQARLEALHLAKLLADEDLYAAEDAIADSEEGAEGDRVPGLVSLSGKMVSDRAFARQLRRKKWL